MSVWGDEDEFLVRFKNSVEDPSELLAAFTSQQPVWFHPSLGHFSGLNKRIGTYKQMLPSRII